MDTPIRFCFHCGRRYDWRRSTSGSLKLTYCSTLCEIAHEGFTIEGLLAMERGADRLRERLHQLADTYHGADS